MAPPVAARPSRTTTCPLHSLPGSLRQQTRVRRQRHRRAWCTRTGTKQRRPRPEASAPDGGPPPRLWEKVEELALFLPAATWRPLAHGSVWRLLRYLTEVLKEQGGVSVHHNRTSRHSIVEPPAYAVVFLILPGEKSILNEHPKLMGLKEIMQFRRKHWNMFYLRSKQKLFWTLH